MAFPEALVNRPAVVMPHAVISDINPMRREGCKLNPSLTLRVTNPVLAEASFRAARYIAVP